MKLVKRETLRRMPVGTCFFPIKHIGTPVWSEFNIISRQTECGFVGVKPVVPYFSRYQLLKEGFTKAFNDNIDTRYWNYETEEYFAVLDRDELENMKESIEYALAGEDLI